MSDRTQPHRRQFVIGPAPISLGESWTSMPIGGGLHLSLQRALPIAEARDRDGAVWYLLGIAIQTDPGRAAPLDEIAVARTHNVEELAYTWSGRWALLREGVLRTDAGGLLGCFWGRGPSDGKLRVSSSPALIRDELGVDDPQPPLRHEVGMEWYPPPASGVAGVSRLLPSQTLALGDPDQPVRHRPLVGHRDDATYGEPLAELETSLRTVFRNLAGTGRPLWLALTGGFDSRVFLAAMWLDRLEFTTFTFEIPGMSSADRVLPPLLAKDAGAPHHFIEPQSFDEDRLRTFEEHTALHTMDRDGELYAWHQWAQVPPGAIVIRANLFALGAAHYYGKLPAHPDSVKDAVQQVYGFAEHHADSAPHRDGIRAWAEWIELHPEQGMDWRDRFYWEQRGAGWVSALEQGIDLMDVESMQPMSCESMMAAMLRIDPTKKYGKRWEVDLAYGMAPFVTDHPYGLGGSMVTRLRRGASAWVHHPSKRRFVTGRTRSLLARTRAARATSQFT